MQASHRHLFTALGVVQLTTSPPVHCKQDGTAGSDFVLQHSCGTARLLQLSSWPGTQPCLQTCLMPHPALSIPASHRTHRHTAAANQLEPGVTGSAGAGVGGVGGAVLHSALHSMECGSGVTFTDCKPAANCMPTRAIPGLPQQLHTGPAAVTRARCPPSPTHLPCYTLQRCRL